jgi:lycopene cyclase domain-containing protein
MPLYTALLVYSIIVPLALSFDKKLQFYKNWKYLLPSISIVALFYIVVDVYFTKFGIWGFNPSYISSVSILGLPIEEWLFFIAIPYASIFLHDCIVAYFPKIRLPDKAAKYLSAGIILISAAFIAFNLDKAYTAYLFSLMAGVLLFSLFDKTNITSSYYCTFAVILIPFIIVNSILTGSFIEEPVVWYNNSENLGIRFMTIPIEDFGYAFSLILFSLLLRAKLANRY